MFTADYYNEYYRTMGMVIREKRLVYYTSMEQIARDLNMKLSQYGKYELGKNMKTKTVIRILTHLRSDPGEFYTEVQKRMSKKYSTELIKRSLCKTTISC